MSRKRSYPVALSRRLYGRLVRIVVKIRAKAQNDTTLNRIIIIRMFMHVYRYYCYSATLMIRKWNRPTNNFHRSPTRQIQLTITKIFIFVLRRRTMPRTTVLQFPSTSISVSPFRSNDFDFDEIQNISILKDEPNRKTEPECK